MREMLCPYCDEKKQRIAELEAENQRLRDELRLCANWMHHGGLLEGDAYTEVRRITLPYWDKEECNALQAALLEGN